MNTFLMLGRKLIHTQAKYPHYVGKSARYNDKSALKVVDKYTKQVATEVSTATATEINEAFRLAQESFEKTRKLPSYKRKDILQFIADKLKKREVRPPSSLLL